jgi:hypothetical protein
MIAHLATRLPRFCSPPMDLDIGSTQRRFQDPLVAGRSWSAPSRALALAAALALGTPATAQEGARASAPACSMSAADRAWIERALEAWRFTSREITGIGSVPNFQAIFFDASCVLTSADALSSQGAEGVTWNAAAHDGSITVPDGREVPVGVTSFASGKDGLSFFVMSTPSVWSANGVGSGPGLETTMVAVLLHEGSHVAQTGPYGKRLGKLIEENSLPDSFNDNALQERFRSNAEFAASVRKETDLLLKAAAQRDDVEARLLAFEARELMRERQARWLVGDDAYLLEAEDLWLTFEGSGQWAAYQWMVHAQGGAQEPADVIPRYARDGEWSQAEGFAVVMALDRIAGPAWKAHAFGDGARTVLEMLDDALSE